MTWGNGLMAFGGQIGNLMQVKLRSAVSIKRVTYPMACKLTLEGGDGGVAFVAGS